jgi:hypothetical protein
LGVENATIDSFAGPSLGPDAVVATAAAVDAVVVVLADLLDEPHAAHSSAALIASPSVMRVVVLMKAPRRMGSRRGAPAAREQVSLKTTNKVKFTN